MGAKQLEDVPLESVPDTVRMPAPIRLTHFPIVSTSGGNSTSG
jgi:hypothetical protein